MADGGEPAAKRPRIEDSKCGIIESISLKNFTCHGQLTVQKLNKNINVLIGQNSSGKSSILSAIVIGLGGKAAVTDRGSMLRCFIKERQRTAQVTIRLRNVGSDPYMREKYGDSIIVERKWNLDGKSVYKLKSAAGRVISSTKAELNDIVDHFNIQVDNPITILNQESSRTFLSTCNPKQMYKFFSYATQLQQIKTDYMEILEQKNIILVNVKIRRKQLDSLKAEVKRWEGKAKRLASLEELIKKRGQLFKLAAWAQVIELEKHRDKVVKFQGQANKKMKQTEGRIKAEKDSHQKANEQHASCEKQLKEFERRLEELEPQHKEAEKTRNQHRRELKSIKKNINKYQEQLKGAETDARSLKERLEEEAKRDKEQVESERKARQERMQEMERELEETEAKQASLSAKADTVLTTISQARESLANEKAHQQELKGELDSLQQQRSMLEASQRDHLKLYGRHTPKILVEVNRAHSRGVFHRKPKGPIGMYFKVEDAKTWSLAVEICFGALLYNFCCHDQHDTKSLRDIFRKVIPDNQMLPGIITANFEDKQYDISRHRVQCDKYPCLLDIVTIDDPIVYNIVIDQRGPEQILLIANKSTAQKYVKYSTPPNCRECYTQDGDHIFAGLEQRFYSCPMNKRSRVLRGDLAGQLKHVIRDIEKTNLNVKKVYDKLSDVKKHLADQESLRAGVYRKQKEFSARICSLQADLKRLQDEEESELNTTVVFDLEQELNETRDQIQSLNESLNLSLDQDREMEPKLLSASEGCMTADKEIMKLGEDIQPLKEKLCIVSLEVARARKNVAHNEAKKLEILKDQKVLQREFQKRDREVQEAIKQAHKISQERLQVKRTAQSIDSEINEITARLEKEQKRHGNPLELTQKFTSALENFRDKERDVTKMENFIQELEEMMAIRQKKFVEFRRSIAMRTKSAFITKMMLRSYTAQLMFDHQREELNIKVDVNADKHRQEMSNILQLSGGEKSFSTVCLLMALWDSVDSPIRAMDEFDVCMDMVNRRIALESLIHYGMHNPHNQFLLISPLDMSSVRPSPNLTVHQLRGPRESRTTDEVDDDDT